MHDLDSLELPRLDFSGAEPGDAAGELGTVQIANPNHIAGRELALASGNAGRQQASAVLTKRLSGAGIDEQRALRMMKERNPPFPALEPRRMVHDQPSFLLAGHNTSQRLSLLP